MIIKNSILKINIKMVLWDCIINVSLYVIAELKFVNRFVLFIKYLFNIHVIKIVFCYVL